MKITSGNIPGSQDNTGDTERLWQTLFGCGLLWAGLLALCCLL